MYQVHFQVKILEIHLLFLTGYSMGSHTLIYIIIVPIMFQFLFLVIFDLLFISNNLILILSLHIFIYYDFPTIMNFLLILDHRDSTYNLEYYCY